MRIRIRDLKRLVRESLEEGEYSFADDPFFQRLKAMGKRDREEKERTHEPGEQWDYGDEPTPEPSLKQAYGYDPDEPGALRKRGYRSGL